MDENYTFASTRGPPFQINSVSATNFRSILSATAELDRFTIFVGPNASGKSNVLDILRFIKDALRFDLDAAISMRHGISAIHHEHSDEPANDISIAVSATINNRNWPSDVRVDYGFSVATEHDDGYEVCNEYANIWHGPGDEPISIFHVDQGNLSEPSTLFPFVRQQSFFDDEHHTDFDKSNLALPTLLRLIRGSAMHRHDTDDVYQTTYLALSQMHRQLMNMRFYHMFPNTIREPQKLSNTTLLDENAANLASVLRAMEKRDREQPSREHPPRMSRLTEYLARLVPGISGLEVTAAGGYLIVRLKHDSVPGGAWIDLSLESDGTVRLLGILTALYQYRNPPLIGIEEPELTVHPGALSTLADVLNEAARMSQLLITTHSPDLIDRVTQSRSVDSVRIVELVDGFTEVNRVPEAQVEAVRRHLFSPGELHRMGDLELK